MVAKEIGRGLVPLLRVSSKTICRLKGFVFILIKFFRCPSRCKKLVWLVIISFMASWAFYGICGRLSFSSMSLPGMHGEIYQSSVSNKLPQRLHFTLKYVKLFSHYWDVPSLIKPSLTIQSGRKAACLNTRHT
jgi:hypothetical protein